MSANSCIVEGYRAASASNESWQQAAIAILTALGEPTSDHRLGLVYCTHHFAEELADIEVFLRQASGVSHWVGTVGVGVCGPGVEFYDEPALSVMLMPLAEEAFHVFSGIREDTNPAMADAADWLWGKETPLLLTHGDPGNQVLTALIQDFVLESGGFMVGGLSATIGEASQLADGVDGWGLGGVMLAGEAVEAATGLTQGCTPIGPIHRVTDSIENILITLDGEPALDVFKRDIGELLARDLRRVNGYIYAALPVEGSDKRDYLVRNLTGIDEGNGVLAIGSMIRTGDQIMFCRRDHRDAVEDMQRMLKDLKRRVGDRTIKAGVYISCASRGPNQFGDGALEVEMIEEELGEFPITGFFANGEISYDRLYGHTGVLTLFL